MLYLTSLEEGNSFPLVFVYFLFCISFHSGHSNLSNVKCGDSGRGWQSDPAQLLGVVITHGLEPEDGLDDTNVKSC